MRMQNFQLLPLSAVRRSPCNNKTRQHCKTSTATMTKHSKKEHVIFPVLLWNTNILTTEFKNFNTYESCFDAMVEDFETNTCPFGTLVIGQPHF